MSAAACGLRCRAVAAALPAIAGVTFGIGLELGGMTDPRRVVGFLDVTGAWDPTLAFVMAAAVLVYAVGFHWIRSRRQEPWFDVAFHAPKRSDIDRRLVLGAAVFGVGWGLAGLCPGPSLVAAASGNLAAILFVGAMLVGMMTATLVRRT